MLTIRRATLSETMQVCGVIAAVPVASWVGEFEGKPVGAGGLAWRFGRCWLWFNVADSRPQFALAAVRQGKKLIAMAKALGEQTVYCWRDASVPSSAKLLRMMGFKPTDEMFEGHEVFACALG